MLILHLQCVFVRIFVHTSLYVEVVTTGIPNAGISYRSLFYNVQDTTFPRSSFVLNNNTLDMII